MLLRVTIRAANFLSKTLPADFRRLACVLLLAFSVFPLAAGLLLLFTGRYPASLFDLLVGLNRWVYRVTAYVALMTDTYPPFRLDQGPADR